MTPNEIAQKKAIEEIEKNINMIKTLCQEHATYGELFFYTYYLHITRNLKLDNTNYSMQMTTNAFDDVCKYLISCIIKFGKQSHVNNAKSLVNIDFTTFLTKIVLHINSNYEAVSLFSLFDKLTVFGERNQYARIDMAENLDNPIIKKHFEYSSRFQEHIHFEKLNMQTHTQFLQKFKTSFIEYDDLCLFEFGITVNEIGDKITSLLDTIVNRLEQNQEKLPLLDNGNINYKHIGTLLHVIKSFIFTESELITIFGKKFLNKLTFNRNLFDEKQLAFHHILRQPLVKLDKEYIASPQLLLDSLFVNIHYTLLESNNQHEYKKRASDIFVNQILTTAKKYNYYEFARELELYEGKKQLGDIDIVLHNKQIDQFILIEAKNHSLPLSVYFNDMIATKKHLQYLQSHWEKKVKTRYSHLNNNHESYKIGEKFKYIIVSKYPEILAHFSDILVLSLNEFDYFMANMDKIDSFEDVYNNLYNQNTLSKEDLHKLGEITNFSLENPQNNR